MTEQTENYDEASPQSAEFFRLIIENIKDYAIFMTDADGRIVNWNPGVERLLGYAESEIVGAPISVIFTEEDVAAGKPAAEMERAARTGCAEDKRWHVRRDGSRFWTNGMVMPLKNSDGALYGFAKVMRDDTAQMLAEEKLARTKLQIDNILESITGGFYALDRDWRFAYINRNSEKLTARDREDLLGKNFWEEFPESIGTPFEENYRRAAREQKAASFEAFYPPLDTWFEVRAYPSSDGLSLYFHDISERKRGELDRKFQFEIAEKVRRDDGDDADLLFDVAVAVGEHLRLKRCFFNEIDTKRDCETVHRDFCAPGVESVAGQHRISGYSSATTAEIEAGKTIVNRDSKIDARTAALYDETYAAANERAYIAVPLLRDGVWVASLWASDDEPRDWTNQEIGLLETVGERAWLAVEKLRNEAALRESSERYRALVEATATTVWHANAEGALTFVGDVWTQVSGQSTEEILKWGWLEALHPDDREHTIETWKTALADKTLYATEFRILTATGEYRWFAASAVPIFDAGGSIREWVGINTDIDERKKSESLVRQSEDSFSTLAEAVPQLVWMAEADGFIFWYNRNWYEYTGKTPADMEGWGWQSVHDAELLPQVMERWSASIQTGEPFEMEFPLRRADGKFRWFLTRVNPLRDANGQIVRWFGTNTDIDEQRRLDLRNRFVIALDEAVRPLETPEEITRTLARLLGEYLDADRCAYAEVETDENHFFIPGDYTKGDMFSIVGHYAMEDFGAEVLRLMRANQPYVVDDVNTDAQITEADLAAYRMMNFQAVVCVPLHKNNRFSACMAVHQKTPRRWLSEEIELVTFVANRFWEAIERARIIKSLHESFARESDARHVAEQANRLKDEFLATLSHELRTPLNAILGWSQVLQSRSLNQDETKKALATIERSARAQNQLIEDLLDVSRITTGKIRLDVRAVDLSNVITSAVDAARPAAEAKNIRLQVLLDPQAGPISGDPDRLQQVVWNLLSNAMKFTPKNGRVQIRLERVNSHVEIVISDTGRGIEAEFLPFVFDRFRQSDGSMTRRHGGLGLGLSIARQLVELHGGSVSVSSAGEGTGATFTVSLPLLPVRTEAESDEPRVHPAAAARETIAAQNNGGDRAAELAGLRVLLVDDEADSRELLKTVLDSCGAVVSAASSAGDALNIVKSAPFDIIVSDIGMPGEDGFSLIAKIRELPREQGGNVPAIALTAYARSEDRIQALRSGFQMHIAKPVEPTELVAVVANLAGRISGRDKS